MSIISYDKHEYRFEFDREDIEELIKHHVIKALSLAEGTDLERIRVHWDGETSSVIVSAFYQEPPEGRDEREGQT